MTEPAEEFPLFIGGTTEGPEDPFFGTADLLNQDTEFFHIHDDDIKEAKNA